MFKGHSPLFVNPNHYGFSMLVSCIHGLSIMVFASQSVILFSTPRLFCLPYSTLVYWHCIFLPRVLTLKKLLTPHQSTLQCLSVCVHVCQYCLLWWWAYEPESVVPKNSFSLSFFSLQSAEENTWKVPMKAMLCYDLYNKKEWKVEVTFLLALKHLKFLRNMHCYLREL